tara:strand:- start:626 stop:1741 length:1116 start_codon:yes stop_codon:yes gene_type:complete
VITIDNNDAIWAADKFIEYFSQMQNIEEYLKYVKKKLVKDSNPLFSVKGDFFNKDVHPEDMNFVIRPVGHRFANGMPQDYYNLLLRSVSSHNNESNIPGREMRWIVYEKNTNLVVGMIRFGSPLINAKPRNNWLGQPPNLKLFNAHSAMGFVIVPSQPFGYNYLGGKLLALMCCSHFAREMLNEVFEKDIALFETTSLYGSTTSASQYDGLKPFMRNMGMTDSKFLPMLHDEAFHELHNKFSEWNDGPLTSNDASGKKLKRQTKMIAIIKKSLTDKDKLNEFTSIMNQALNLTQQKRFYISTYGYENTREVILGEQETLRKGPSWDKYYLENIIKWWKKKATNRYNKLKEENRFRDKVELWTEDDDIQIIR